MRLQVVLLTLLVVWLRLVKEARFRGLVRYARRGDITRVRRPLLGVHCCVLERGRLDAKIEGGLQGA